MGMFTAITLLPVMAHKAEVTALSIPPEMSTTNPFVPEETE
jgi:hypothetical protein